MSNRQKVINALCETARKAKVTIKELASALAYVSRNVKSDLKTMEEFRKMMEVRDEQGN